MCDSALVRTARLRILVGEVMESKSDEMFIKLNEQNHTRGMPGSACVTTNSVKVEVFFFFSFLFIISEKNTIISS